MIKTTRCLTTLCACFCLARPVLAWNAEGHMVVAQIAYNHLDPEVKAKCDTLIAVPVYQSSSLNSNFVTASVWADDIKSFTSAYNAQHYINIPISLDGYPTNSFVIDPTNVVTAIQQHIATLQNPAATLSNQAVALRFLLHFVGDIQQPLHCTTGIATNKPTGDLGGNTFSLNGAWSNLHSLWDAGGGYLNDSISRSPFTSASRTILSNKAAVSEAAYPYTLSVGVIPDPMDWAQEGREIARTNSYVGITPNTTPSVSYTNAAQATTVQRMAIGGQRLAKLLNTIFVTNAPNLIAVAQTNGDFNLSWGAVSGRSYRVQCKPLVTDAVWSNLTDITAFTNSISYTDSMAPPQRFYRVIVVN